MNAPAAPIDVRAVGRALSQVENRGPEATALLRAAYAHGREPPVVGLAGPPGAGKSTLVDALALHWAEAGENVALLAVDPSSPYTGGALLGDRFRMDRASAHPRVYLRSLSSRGQQGGLCRALPDLVMVLGQRGFARVIVETVGSGQADTDVAAQCDVVAVLSVPGLGDQIQAAKSGLLEVGDLFVVNKADLPGANVLAAQLQAQIDLVYAGRPGVNPRGVAAAVVDGDASIALRHGAPGDEARHWIPPVLQVAARTGDGVAALVEAVDDFLAWQRASGRSVARRDGRLERHLKRLAGERWMADAHTARALPPLAALVREGRLTPDAAAEALLDALAWAWSDRRKEST